MNSPIVLKGNFFSNSYAFNDNVNDVLLDDCEYMIVGDVGGVFLMVMFFTGLSI